MRSRPIREGKSPIGSLRPLPVRSRIPGGRLHFFRITLACALLSGCAAVPQAEREFLSDPILQRQEDGLEAALESHDFPRREGSVGGNSGSGGGCGC